MFGNHSQFVELNLYIYHSVRGVIFDGVIWCLAPVIEDSRRFGLFRVCLAAATCTLCRRILRVAD